jgi:hypothetical protein
MNRAGHLACWLRGSQQAYRDHSLQRCVSVQLRTHGYQVTTCTCTAEDLSRL